MNTPQDPRPSAVPTMAKQDGNVQDRWPWTEPAVWTERMLTALEQGVKGGVWFSLIDKVFAERNLRLAAAKVAANHGAPGVDHVTVESFLSDVDTNVAKLTAALRDGSYEPQAIRRVYIPKPGSSEQRPLGIPMVRAYCTPFQKPWGWIPCWLPSSACVRAALPAWSPANQLTR